MDKANCSFPPEHEPWKFGSAYAQTLLKRQSSKLVPRPVHVQKWCRKPDSRRGPWQKREGGADILQSGAHGLHVELVKGNHIQHAIFLHSDGDSSPVRAITTFPMPPMAMQFSKLFWSQSLHF